MAQLFAEEQTRPENAARTNFVFLAYPFTPVVAQEDYSSVVRELQADLPLRLWYFLDEITTQELMRKIWRAILRADLCVFDVSGGNPNVAFELGLAAAIGKKCITLLKTGESNPLGAADLGYSERVEYSSRETLKAKLRLVLTKKSLALRVLSEISNLAPQVFDVLAREQDARHVRALVSHVFTHKRLTKAAARQILGDDERRAGVLLNALRDSGVLRVEGSTKAAAWVFTDAWVHHDHEVVGD